MARGGSVGFELVVRFLLIALQIRGPVFGEMLRDSPFVSAGPAYHMVDDSAGSYPVFLVSGHIGGSQESLNSMHVGVQAPVVVQHGEFRVPGITGKALFLVPEAQIVKLQSVFQKLFGSGTPGQNAGGCCQDHEGVGVALFGGKNPAVRGQSCIPSAVGVIMQLPSQTLQAGVCQLPASRMAQEAGQAVYVYHTAGDPCLPVSVRPGGSVVAQIIGTSARGGEFMSETEQILPDFFQKFFVFFGINLILSADFAHWCIPFFPVFYLAVPKGRPEIFTILYNNRRAEYRGKINLENTGKVKYNKKDREKREACPWNDIRGNPLPGG